MLQLISFKDHLLIVSIVAIFTCLTAFSQSTDSDDLNEFESPEVLGYYLPVLWDNPFTRSPGRPVVDVILDRDGKVIQADLITGEYKDMEDILAKSAAACAFSPAYAEGKRIEGFYRYPVQSCLFLKEREKASGHIDKLPSPKFRVSRNTMTQIFFFAQSVRKTSFGFHVTVDTDGNITKFEGIEEESKQLADAHLKEFAGNVKFQPAESDGKPVKCAMTLVFDGLDGRMSPATMELISNSIGEEANPLPAMPESSTHDDSDYSVGLSFLRTGAVQKILILSQMQSPQAIAAIDAFRKWKLDTEYLAKAKGVVKATYRYGEGNEMASLVKQEAGPSIQPPKAVRQTAPVYPKDLRRAGIQGYVVIEFMVDKSGKVRNPEPIISTHLGFTQEAMAVLKKWKFQPAEKDGKPINARARQVIPFKIRE